MGRGGEDEKRPLGGGAGGEEGKTMETGEPGMEGAMSGGKLTPEDLMKATRETRREGEDQRGASGATDETPWRWRARASALAGQRRTAWLKVSSSSPQAGQIFEEVESNQEGWAAR